MKLKCDKKTAKMMLEAADAINDETLFQFGKDAVEIRQMDPGQIAMVSFSIPKSKFAEYSVEGEKELLMFSVKDALKAVLKAGDTIGIETVGNKLQIKSIGLGATTTFFASLIDRGANSLGKVPTIVPIVKIVLKTSDLRKAISDVEDMSGTSHISFRFKEGNFRISGLGDKNEAVMDFTQENKKTVISIDAPVDDKGKLPEIHTVYPVKYLIDLLGAINSDNVRLELKTNTPLIMRDTELDISVFLAPRIQND